MKINLGSGENHKEGYLNIDCRKEANPDLLMNIGIDKFDLKDNSVDEVFSYHTFEHFPNFVEVVNELGRISKDGCIWDITVPYATNYVLNVINPYHINPLFTEHTFRFWADIYEREQPKHFKLEILSTDYVYNKELYGKDADWDRLKQTNINVVKMITQKIKVIK